jgi:hypothetical protein
LPDEPILSTVVVVVAAAGVVVVVVVKKVKRVTGFLYKPDVTLGVPGG